MGLPSAWEIQPVLSGLGSYTFNRAFGLLTSDAFALSSYGAMDALAINHNVDAVTTVSVALAFCHDSMLIDPFTTLQGANGWPG
ncbi:hypothetical protein GCM10023115_05720 [Pontixanthobacter gangjinensis]